MVLGTCLWRVFFMYNWLKKVLLISLPGINSGDNANHMEPIDDSMYARYISYRWFYSIRLPFLVEGDAILIFGGWVNLSHCSNPEVDAFTSHGTRKRDYLLVLLCLFFLYPSVSCSQMTKWMALHYTAVTASFCSSLTLVDQSYLLQLAPFSLPFFFFFFFKYCVLYSRAMRYEKIIGKVHKCSWHEDFQNSYFMHGQKAG